MKCSYHYDGENHELLCKWSERNSSQFLRHFFPNNRTKDGIQQQASVSKYIAKAHHLTQPCSSKGLTWMMVVLLTKDVISVLTLLIQSTN